MKESTVSNVVAFLFGGMIFLLAFTRLGGLWTVGLALAILVVYLLVEAWREWQLRRQSGIAVRRMDQWAVADKQRQSSSKD